MSQPLLPTVFGGATAQYPVTKRFIFDTGIAVAANGTEQRWVRNPPLVQLEVPFSDFMVADRDALLAFHAQERGMGLSNWALNLGVVGSDLGQQLFQNLAFEHDSIDFGENDNLLYGVTLRFRQTIPDVVIPAPQDTFPQFSGGTVAQLPFGPSWRSLTACSEMPTGRRYSYSFYGPSTGLTNYPARQLRSWKLSYPAMPDLDVVNTLQPFFLGCQGRWRGFTFPDTLDTGNAYPNCRFDTDVLEIVHVSQNRAQCSFVVRETYA